MNIKYINTSEDRMKDCERWKQAKENLKMFKGMMKFVKQYHLKRPVKQAPPSPPYETPNDLFPYLF